MKDKIWEIDIWASKDTEFQVIVLSHTETRVG